MLQKMGWKKDTKLGVSGNGILEPIKVESNSREGIGVETHEKGLIHQATKIIPKLAQKMTSEVTEKAELAAQKEEFTKNAIKELTRSFYCDICKKQYKTTMEMQNHLSSYDHHHTKRMRETVREENAKNSELIRKREGKRDAERIKRQMKQIETVKREQQNKSGEMKKDEGLIKPTSLKRSSAQPALSISFKPMKKKRRR
eukprot:TRINITY_DN4900_c0_g1_i1.p1 TRINITY_DN4900_c0_g1~~TRINITY_DN4900_c0_g1_i1.p1  ORF type:complete len:219 (+),score=52.35 TRINITY_DN4900_c0_g1_i1:60-659(+)